MSNYNTQDENIPIYLSHAAFLATIIIHDLKKDDRLVVSGVEEAVESINSSGKYYGIGTVDDFEERFNLAATTVFEKIESGKLSVSLNASRKPDLPFFKYASDDQLRDSFVCETINAWKRQLISWKDMDAAA